MRPSLIPHQRFGAALGSALSVWLSPEDRAQLEHVRQTRRQLHWPTLRRLLGTHAGARDAVIGTAYGVLDDPAERERVVRAFLHGLRDGTAAVEMMADDIERCCAANAARH